MRRTPVYIVCSPRPQVGKTLIARLLVEFLLLLRGDVLAFDINLGEPSLIDYLPRITETADMTDTQGQMAVMDRVIVNDGIAKVIDLGYHAFDPFFQMCDEIGFFKESMRRGVEPVVLFVSGSDRFSPQHFTLLRERYPTAAIIPVDNEHILRGEVPAPLMQARVLPVAALPSFLKTYVDRLNFSFTAFLRNTNNASSELYTWIRDNYARFRDLEINLIDWKV